MSPGLLRHHYGSKEALRQACDDYVFEMLHRVNAQILEDPAVRPAPPATSQRFGRYVAPGAGRRVATVGAIFDEMVTMTEQWLARADEARVRPAGRRPADPGRAGHRHGGRRPAAPRARLPGAGRDMFGPEGDRLVALALLDIYSHPLLDDEAAAAARAGFDAGQA